MGAAAVHPSGILALHQELHFRGMSAAERQAHPPGGAVLAQNEQLRPKPVPFLRQPFDNHVKHEPTSPYHRALRAYYTPTP